MKPAYFAVFPIVLGITDAQYKIVIIIISKKPSYLHYLMT